MAIVDFAVFSWATMNEADCMQTSHHLLIFFLMSIVTSVGCSFAFGVQLIKFC